MLRGGESGQVVLEPGNAAASLLYTATTGDSPDYRMPPKENGPYSASPKTTIGPLPRLIHVGTVWPGNGFKPIESTRFVGALPA